MAMALSLPKFAKAQTNLLGVWRLKEFKKIKGPDYANGIPLIIKIEQKQDGMAIEKTSNLGDRDTVIKASLVHGLWRDYTKTGKKRKISFKQDKENNIWLRQTEIYTEDDTTKVQTLDKETFIVYGGINDNVLLKFTREYNTKNESINNEDFLAEGFYEKVTPEQLTKETARGKGINFVEGLNWEQIKAKARAENKLIFLDCYATWCIPCKMMDRNVYPLNMVGEAMNDAFIAVKVQMDSTKKDAAATKLLYPLARQIEKEYSISVLPSYLFFSADGTPLHKAVGQQNPKQFIELLTNAGNPEYQLYTLLNKARQKELPWTEYITIAKKLRDEFGEMKLAEEVAGIYNQQYLNKLAKKELLAKPILDFIGEYYGMVKSSDKIFQLSLKHPHLVDSIKAYEGGGWAAVLVKKTIIRENIQPFLQEAEKTGKSPSWQEMEIQLTKKYSKKLAVQYVLKAKLDWYEKKKNWNSFFQYLTPYVANYDINTMDRRQLYHLHWCVWYVFKYCNDKALMQMALRWIDPVIERWVNQGTEINAPMDTKACLLYKMGRKEEAIKLQQSILEMFPDMASGTQIRINAMLKGEEIWLTFR